MVDERPSFTLYRMTSTGEDGVERHTTGVIGALELSPPGTDILPHEHTTKKAKSDRLDLLRVVPGQPLGDLGAVARQGPHRPARRCTSRRSPTSSTRTACATPCGGSTTRRPCAAISAAVAEQPVVVADGHHRYETSLTYKAEREAADGDAGEAGATLAYLVELVEDELTVHAIHRLLSGLPDGIDLVAALAPWFEDAGPPPADAPVTAAMADGRLPHPRAPRPRGAAAPPARRARRRARPRLQPPRRRPGVAPAARARASSTASTTSAPRSPAGDAQAGVLLRPVTVAQIEATAHGGERMPPKSTFFHPKPKTGLVFRSLG